MATAGPFHPSKTARIVYRRRSSGRLKAVQKAQELQPDLILLDIGLPNLNGLEAAKAIRQIAPKARIIFLTQNSDIEIMQAALSTGARGYVLKTDAVSELLPAVEAVLANKEFVSSGLKGYAVGQPKTLSLRPQAKPKLRFLL